MRTETENVTRVSVALRGLKEPPSMHSDGGYTLMCKFSNRVFLSASLDIPVAEGGDTYVFRAYGQPASITVDGELCMPDISWQLWFHEGSHRRNLAKSWFLEDQKAAILVEEKYIDGKFVAAKTIGIKPGLMSG